MQVTAYYASVPKTPIVRPLDGSKWYEEMLYHDPSNELRGHKISGHRRGVKMRHADRQWHRHRVDPRQHKQCYAIFRSQFSFEASCNVYCLIKLNLAC